ncbi:MAG: efflux RND transporter permease subunit, partial [Gemmatimonadales bacterium]
PEQILDTPVGPAGAGIRLRDLASVERTIADPLTLTRLDGGAAVGLVVYKDAGANTVRVTAEIERVLNELADELPAVRASVVSAQAGFITSALGNLVQEIVLGTLFAFGVLVLFLRDVRAALAIGVVIPLSVIVALIVMQALGVTLNVLSLGGLALGVGMLVDNAIVVSEAASRRREGGMEGGPAALAASAEVGGPLVAATLSTLLVFGPIVFVRGLAAALFRDLSLAVVAALGGSLLVALTVLPVLIRKAGRPRAPDRASRVSVWGGRGVALYERVLEGALARPLRTIGVTAAIGVPVVVIAWLMPKDVMPPVNERMIAASVALPEGTALEATTAQVARIEETARRHGAGEVYARVGRPTDEEILAGVSPGGSNTAELLIPVARGSVDGLAGALRAELLDLARGALALDLSGQGELGAFAGRAGRTLVVELSAANRAVAERAAGTVAERLVGVSGLADVRLQTAGLRPSVQVSLKRDRIAALGAEPEAVAGALAGGLRGIAASELRETERRTPIVVRLAGAAHQNLPAALATRVNGVPLGQLVEVREVPAPVELVRVNQRPVLPVEALVTSGGTARAASRVETALGAMDLAPGVTWRLAGADLERRRTMGELTLVALLAVALVFLVLAAEFESFRTPLLVMTAVPLAALGGIVALVITGQSLNAVSLIGLVVVMGIADNDAVVKLATIRRLRGEGHALLEALRLAGHERLRPIIMVNLTTLVGVLPLAIGFGAGASLYRPLAVAILGGLASAMLVTLVLLPAVYAVVERRAVRS